MCKYCRIFFRWWIWKDTLRAKLKSCWLDFWGLFKDNEFDVWNNAQLIQLFPYNIFVFWTTQKTLTKCRNLLKCNLFRFRRRRKVLCWQYIWKNYKATANLNWQICNVAENFHVKSAARWIECGFEKLYITCKPDSIWT